MARRSDSEELAASLFVVGLILAVLLAVLVGKLLLALLSEVGRIYVEQGPLPASVRRVLWGALAGFGLLALLCLVVSLLTASAVPIAIAIVCWAFLGFVLVIEGADWWGRRHLGPPSLDTYLPFPPAGNTVGDATPAPLEMAV